MEEGFYLGGGADGDPQIIADFGILEPADEDSLVTEFLKPCFGREFGWLSKDEIGLAGKDAKPELGELSRKSLAVGDDFLEIFAVVR